MAALPLEAANPVSRSLLLMQQPTKFQRNRTMHI